MLLRMEWENVKLTGAEGRWIVERAEVEGIELGMHCTHLQFAACTQQQRHESMETPESYIPRKLLLSANDCHLLSAILQQLSARAAIACSIALDVAGQLSLPASLVGIILLRASRVDPPVWW